MQLTYQKLNENQMWNKKNQINCNIDKNDTYRLHIAFRKIFRFIFKLPIWSHISELLSVFGVPVVCDVVNEKELNIMMQCLGSRFDELKYLVLINMYSLSLRVITVFQNL